MTVLRGYAIINKFQSTHPRGVRPDRLRILFRMYIVSIHAPAWGATRSRGAVSITAISFNPRTRVGCDAVSPSCPRTTGKFQSTHPRGVRQISVSAPLKPATFQSTHPRGVRRFRRWRWGHGHHVSIHAPAWGATPPSRPTITRSARFQSTHPRGVRPATRAVSTSIRASFNPRTRVGCDHPARAHPRDHGRFNPRTRVGCDARTGEGDQWRVVFQSTHPRGVRQGGAFRPAAADRVSIHAPAWGATCMPRVCCVSWAMFQSTHPRGVRRPSPPSRMALFGFQSTHPRGVRRAQDSDPAVEQQVSIHAPAWGATRCWRATFAGRGCFNPRTRVGCDIPLFDRFEKVFKFQSTHPRGVRLHCIDSPEDLFGVSIHAPAWGATLLRRRQHEDRVVSIHAPAWGATPSAARSFHLQSVSIHAPAWGATSTREGINVDIFTFQSTHPRGVRRLGVSTQQAGIIVSIHAPAWGATCNIINDRYNSLVFQSTHPRGVRPKLGRPYR